MISFWNKLSKPIMVLAPMADVTDAAFRRIIAEKGKPDVMWTEFVSADGLARAPEEGRKKLLLDLIYSEKERPIVAQFFTSAPEHMKKAAELARELGFDGIDINMGCPDKGVEKQGAGSCLIKTPEVARALIRAAKEGAGDLPVSVKTRVGYNKPELESWLPELLKEEPAVVTLHARTRKEMSKVPAQWEHVKRAVEIRDELGSKTLIFGNGDVKNLAEARKRVEETGCDGVMLGRAIFGNPWCFNDGYEADLKERLETLSKHIALYDELLGHAKNFAIMKKHFKSYIGSFEGAAEFRNTLLNSQNALEAREIIDNFLGSLSR
jgi:nifR3 family TIM-barrel protein